MVIFLSMNQFHPLMVSPNGFNVDASDLLSSPPPVS